MAEKLGQEFACQGPGCDGENTPSKPVKERNPSPEAAALSFSPTKPAIAARLRSRDRENQAYQSFFVFIDNHCCPVKRKRVSRIIVAGQWVEADFSWCRFEVKVAASR
jgi:hypothetical protein